MLIRATLMEATLTSGTVTGAPAKAGKSLVSVALGSTPTPLQIFSAFSCWQGHVFLVMSDEADVRKYDLTKSELIIL